MSSRREVLTALGIASAAALAAKSAAAQPAPAPGAAEPGAASASNAFWPNGARIAVSASLMLEAGGQNLFRSDALFGEVKCGREAGIAGANDTDIGVDRALQGARLRRRRGCRIPKRRL